MSWILKVSLRYFKYSIESLQVKIRNTQIGFLIREYRLEVMIIQWKIKKKLEQTRK